MGKNETEQEYIFDAFISYRHMPLDKAVAERLQVLLESFRLKNTRKLRIFRDQSELTTSNDLGGEIRKALLRSRYLIVVCSEYTKESAWCMEEIRLFKEAHKGSTKHILTLIISGEPSQVLPESLRWETRPVSLKTGRTVLQKEAVEPLSADIRADTRRKSLRKLKVEFLRIAAPILECGFDELFQRRQRRQRKNAVILFAGSLTLLACILIVVSAFAYRTKVSETNYRNILVDNYTREGNRYANAGNPQEALLYYTQALTLNPEKTSAASGAALLLQEYLWPVLKEDIAGSGGYDLPPEEPPFDCSTLPYLDEASKGCTTDPLFSDYGLCAFALGENKVIAAHNGLVHIYTLDAQGMAAETARADLAEAFPVDAAQNGISKSNNIRLSPDGSLALVSSYSHAALYDTNTLTLKAAVPRYFDGLTGMDISADNQYFVLSYGNPYRLNLLNPGGCFEVYSCDGELCFTSPQSEKDALMGTAFHPAIHDRLLVWGADFVQLWDWKEGREIMAPIRVQSLSSASLTDDEFLLVTDKGPVPSVYELTEFLPPAVTYPSDEGVLPYIQKYYMDAEGPDGMVLSVKSDSLSLTDKEGTILDTVSLPAMGQRVALSGDYRKAYLYNENYPALMTVPVDFEAGKLGEVRQLDTGTEAALGIWFGESWLACETSSRNLLLFDQNGRQFCKILPRHNGNIVSILTDPQMQYVVCVLESTTGSPHSYHFDKTGIIEIWDVSSQLLLSSFQRSGKEIDKTFINESGTLVWNVDSKTYVRQLSVPAPDKDTLQFLQGLCCLTLDSGQDFALKRPSLLNLHMDSWAILERNAMTVPSDRQPPKENTQPSEKEDISAGKQAFIQLVNELYSSESSGEDLWFEQCNALWQRLLNGELDYTASELDTFYLVYASPVLYSGSTDKLLFGLEAYISLIQNLLKESILLNETVLSEFHIRLLDTLAATQEYDEIIIQAFHDISLLNTGGGTGNPASGGDDFLADMDAAQQDYLSQYLEAWSQILNGKGPDAMTSLAGYCAANSEFLPLMEAEPAALSSLYAGDSQTAADAVNRFITEGMQMFTDSDISLLEDQLSNWLFSGELLVWRGKIEPSVFDEYLRRIDADFGIKVQEVTPQAQHAGLLPGDLIVEADGWRIAGVQHYSRLRNNEKPQDFKVLRKGESLTLTISGPAEFAGNMAVDFH